MLHWLCGIYCFKLSLQNLPRPPLLPHQIKQHQQLLQEIHSVPQASLCLHQLHLANFLLFQASLHLLWHWLQHSHVTFITDVLLAFDVRLDCRGMRGHGLFEETITSMAINLPKYLIENHETIFAVDQNTVTKLRTCNNKCTLTL